MARRSVSKTDIRQVGTGTQTQDGAIIVNFYQGFVIQSFETFNAVKYQRVSTE